MMKTGSIKHADFLKEINHELVDTIEVLQTQDYDFFIEDPQNNRRVRTNTVHYEKLKRSIKELGLINPVFVIPKKVEGKSKGIIASGQHRVRACKELNAPIKFVIVDNNNYSRIMQFVLDSTTLPNVVGEFVEIGAARGYEAFELVMELMEDYNDYFCGITVPFETVMTFLKNRNKHIFYVSPFKESCSENPEKTEAILKEIEEIKVYSEDRHNIYDYIDTLSRIVMEIGRNTINTNFNREMLKLLSPHKEVEITPIEILKYFTTEDEKEKNTRDRLKRKLAQVFSGSGKEIRSVFKEIEERILAPKEKKRRREMRIGKGVKKPKTRKTKTSRE